LLSCRNLKYYTNTCQEEQSNSVTYLNQDIYRPNRDSKPKLVKYEAAVWLSGRSASAAGSQLLQGSLSTEC